MMEETMIELLKDLGIAGGTGFFTWLFARKKYNAEVNSDVIDNLSKALEFYQKISDDNTERLNKYQVEQQKLGQELDEWRKRCQDLEKEISELRDQQERMYQVACFKATCIDRESGTKKKRKETV